MIRGGLLIVFLAGTMIASGCGGSSGESTGGNVSRPAPNTANPVAANAPASSPLERGKSGDILSVLTVEHQVDVAAQRDGVVTSISKDEGGGVKVGEVLAQLDDRSLQEVCGELDQIGR